MKLLLDTHLIIWSVSDPKKISKSTQSYIMDADALYVSAASIWEMSIKIQLNKLQLDLAAFIQEITNLGVQSLNINWQHTRLIKELPLHHQDPFDRLLIAQAMTESLLLLTNDHMLSQYGEQVKYVD